MRFTNPRVVIGLEISRPPQRYATPRNRRRRFRRSPCLSRAPRTSHFATLCNPERAPDLYRNSSIPRFRDAFGAAGAEVGRRLSRIREDNDPRENRPEKNNDPRPPGRGPMKRQPRTRKGRARPPGGFQQHGTTRGLFGPARRARNAKRPRGRSLGALKRRI